MKYNRIMFFFGLSTPIGVLLRLIQIIFTTDEKGFTNPEYKVLSFILSFVIVAMAAVCAIFGYLTYKQPQSFGKKGIVVSLFSALLGILIVADLLVFIPLSVTIPSWQNYIMLIFGFLAAAVLVLFSVRSLFPFKLSPIIFVFPLLYWVSRLIWSFTLLNTLALTCDHILLLIAHCAILLFMLEFAKAANSVDTERGFKRLLAYGLCAAALCFSYSLPYIILMAMGFNAVVDGYSPILILLVMGAFTLSFVLTHFGKKNIEN